ncbi:hypothetical protein [Leptolyngbya sp. FACHB-671]|uniref:hypothetical protein n=1 Tax=Leptolyngbya sp. FACHB-671 TaxID=2692812 RepID=UPI0016885AC3|nr:hypothetical protein [Leptolyngbya sp. FACHB-671]
MQFQHVFRSKDWYLGTFWLVVGLFAVVFSLELATPPEYVFGYLYIGPILLASAHLSRKVTFQATLMKLSELSTQIEGRSPCLIN